MNVLRTLLVLAVHTVTTSADSLTTLDAEAHCQRSQRDRHPPSHMTQILAGLRDNGFAVVRGGSSSHSRGWFGSESTLDTAHAEAVSALEQLREAYDAQLAQNLTLPPAPWLGGDDFWYREGYTYTRARLNMPLLGQRAPFNATPFRAHPDVTWLCNEFYGASNCAQTTQGCLWNFPGSHDTSWHRDYDEDWQLLTVVTAATDYPQDIGWIVLQPGTQYGGPWWKVSSDIPPSTSHGEPSAHLAVLHKGDTLIFTATTKHAATPNPTGLDRGLLFSIYSVGGRWDTRTQPQTAKSLLRPGEDTRATRKCVCKPTWRSSFCEPAVQHGCQSSGQCDEDGFCVPEDFYCVGRDGAEPELWGVYCDESHNK